MLYEQGRMISNLLGIRTLADSVTGTGLLEGDWVSMTGEAPLSTTGKRWVGQSFASDVQGVSGALPWDPVRKQLLPLTMILSPLLIKKSHPRIYSSGDSKLEQTKKEPAQLIPSPQDNSKLACTTPSTVKDSY